MRPFPETPDAGDAPDDPLGEGHLWVQEWVDGGPLRFRLRASGALEFGDEERPFGDDAPPPYRHAVRHVRERLDREALRASAEDVEDVVFFGVATHRRGVDYDWAAMPPFLGVDVWAGDRGTHLSPDRAEQAYESLGLEPANTLAKEVRAADVDPGSYEFPASAWRDGPVAGVLFRSKTGDRLRLRNPDVGDEPPALPDSAREVAERYVTRRRLDRLAADLEELGRPVTADRLSERVVEDVLREIHGPLLDGPADVELGDLRSEVARMTARYLRTE